MMLLNISNSLVLIVFITTAALGQTLSAPNAPLNSDSLNRNGNVSQLEGEASPKGTGNLVWLTGGINTSTILHEEGPWLPGYSIGLTFVFKINKKFSLVIPGAYTRIEAAPRNLESVQHGDDFGDPIYKIFVDREISFAALEIPILLSYRLSSTKSYAFTYMLGAGIVLAVNESSKTTNVTRTDEIVGYNNSGCPSFGASWGLHDHSGLNIISGIGINKDPLYLDLLYHYSLRDKLIDTNRLNSISLRLGFNPAYLSGLVQRLVSSNKN